MGTNKRRTASPEMGPCCCCGDTRRVRNIVMIHRRARVPGTGWGCVVCGLPCDGAVYVACDDCLKASAAPREVLDGYATSGGRIPIDRYEDGRLWFEPDDGSPAHFIPVSCVLTSKAAAAETGLAFDPAGFTVTKFQVGIRVEYLS